MRCPCASPETPAPGADEIEQLAYTLNQEEEEAPSKPSSFLEQMLVDQPRRRILRGGAGSSNNNSGVGPQGQEVGT